MTLVSATEPQYPLSIAVKESGIIYLADRNLPGIWKLENEKLTIFFQGSKTFRTPLNAIRCVAVDRDGNLLAGDSSTREVYRFDESGKPAGLTHQNPATPAAESTASPSAKKESAKKEPAKKEPEKKELADHRGGVNRASRPPFIYGEIGIPMDIAVDAAGDLYVSDLETHRVMKVAKQGGLPQPFAQVQAPRGICFDSDQNLWVVSNRKLIRISPTGERTTVVEDGIFNFPHTVAVAPDKTAFVCDGYEKCVWKIAPGGKPEKLVSGEPLVNPVGMRWAGDKLYVVDPRAKAVFQITQDGKLTSVALKP